MERSSTLIVVTLLALIIVGGAAAADIAPHVINYQGRLLDDMGNPVEGVVTMVFTIYGSADGSDIIWQETHSNVLVEDGLFQVLLGEGDVAVPVDDGVFTTSERWLGVKVEDQPEITPRTRLASVPYSERVNTVDQANAGVIYGNLQLQQSLNKDGLVEDAKLIVLGNAGDSVIISPGEDVGLRMTDNEGDGAVLITGNSTGGAVLITASDAAKASGQTLGSVEISPGDNIVLKALDANQDDAVLITADQNGGTILITASDAAKSQILRTVQISPSDNIILKATEANQDDVVLITADESGGTILVTASDAAKADPATITGSVIINEDGIFIVNDQDQDTTLSILANGDITGDGQLAMGENSSNTGDGSAVLGLNNTASGNHSTVAGGQYNDVQSDYSAILGGYADTIFATGNYSYLFGVGSTLGADSTFMVDLPHIRFGDEASGYEFPTVDGSSGQVLVTDGAGQLGWTAPNFAGGGWKEEDNYVVLDHNSDSVGIGTATPAEKLDVAGNIHASGVISSGNSIIIDGINNEITADTQLVLRNEDGFYFTGNNGGNGVNLSLARLINTSTGAYLSGDGIWTDNPSYADIRTVSAAEQQSLLDKIASLSIKRWNSSSQDGVEHIGPTAADLKALFGIGDGQSISSVDPAGIALVAIQMLYQSVQAQKQQLQQISELQSQLADLAQLKEQVAQMQVLIDNLNKAQE
jgi:hypothetical protein